MPAASRLNSALSPAELADLAEWLGQRPHVTVDEFSDELARRGVVVSRSTAARAKNDVKAWGDWTRQARAVMSGVAAHLDPADESGQTRVVLEGLRLLAFDVVRRMSADDPDARPDPQTLATIASVVKSVASTAKIDQAYRGRVLDEAAERAESVADRAGLPDEVAAAIRAAVMGGGA